MLLVVLLLVIGEVNSLDEIQLDGLKKLLPKSENIFATCKLILFKEFVNFTTAYTRCKEFNVGGGNVAGNLATVNDEAKNTDIKFLLGLAYRERKHKNDRWSNDQWAWVGLQKVKNNAKNKKENYKAEDWEWADGSTPVDYHKWMTGQPDHRHKKQTNSKVKMYQDNLRINHQGGWDDTYITKTHPYVCDYKGKYVFSTAYKSWSDAKAACKAAGLIMAKVRDMSEVNEITALAKLYLGEWNAKEFHASNWIWLGGNDEESEGTWRWNDGEIIEWFSSTVKPKMPWRNPMPDNATFIGDLAQHYLAISKLGKFDDSFDSKRKKRPFACQCPED